MEKIKKINRWIRIFLYKFAQHKINGIPIRRYLSGLLCCAYILSLEPVPLFAIFFSSFPYSGFEGSRRYTQMFNWYVSYCHKGVLMSSFFFNCIKKLLCYPVSMCCRLLLYFIFSGNLALCDAFNNLRIDEWRKLKAKKWLVDNFWMFTKQLVFVVLSYSLVP